MKNVTNTLKKLYQRLEDSHIIHTVVNLNNCFFDEPKRYCYLSKPNLDSFKFNNRIKQSISTIFGAGIDFDKQTSLLKSFVELIEKLSVLIFDNYYQKKSSSYRVFGTAGGFDHASTLLRAIYELIEIDTYSRLASNQSHFNVVDWSRLNNHSIIRLKNQFTHYHLQFSIFEIKSEYGIPVYLTVLIDVARKPGALINIGVKTGLNKECAILASMEDALLSRIIWRRIIAIEPSCKTLTSIKEIYLNNKKLPGSFLVVKPTWKKIGFLLRTRVQKPLYFVYREEKITVNQQLRSVQNFINKNSRTLTIQRIKLNDFDQCGVIVYKAIKI